MTVVLTPTREDLEARRAELVGGLRMSVAEFEARAERYLLSTDEMNVYEEYREISYLLGEDESAA